MTIERQNKNAPLKMPPSGDAHRTSAENNEGIDMKLQQDDLSAILHALSRVDFRVPIKKYEDKDYSDNDVREIVMTMRRQLDEVKSNPTLEDVYETTKKDWQDEYAIMTALADMRGIELC